MDGRVMFLYDGNGSWLCMEYYGVLERCGTGAAWGDGIWLGKIHEYSSFWTDSHVRPSPMGDGSALAYSVPEPRGDVSD